MNENQTKLPENNERNKDTEPSKKELEPESKLDETIRKVNELKKSFFAIKGIDTILNAISAGLIIACISVSYEDYIKLKLDQIFIGGYLLFFSSVIMLTKIYPIQIYTENFKFMDVKFGPAFFSIFIGKVYVNKLLSNLNINFLSVIAYNLGLYLAHYKAKLVLK